MGFCLLPGWGCACTAGVPTAAPAATAADPTRRLWHTDSSAIPSLSSVPLFVLVTILCGLNWRYEGQGSRFFGVTGVLVTGMGDRRAPLTNGVRGMAFVTRQAVWTCGVRLAVRLSGMPSAV
ncbi:hypothetical protein GCM10027200_66990 [Lentzea nigeriaca]